MFPGVAVIWAHGGYTGLAEARRMLARHPNLHYELSARREVAGGTLRRLLGESP